jgi:ATP-dependent helicase/nuclease subunit B
MTDRHTACAVALTDDFWRRVAQDLRRFAEHCADGDLSALTVVVPRPALLVELRDGFAGAGVVAAPRGVALTDLTQEALLRFGPSQLRSELACRAELFAVLRRTAWLAQALGGPADPWQLAGDLRALVAELLATPATDSGSRFAAAAQSLYAGRAWSALSQEAQLVAAVLGAVRGDAHDPANARPAALRRLAAQSAAPLVLLPRPGPQAEMELLRAHWAGPVLDLSVDWAATGAHWARWAWPELTGEPAPAPLPERAVPFAAAWQARPAQLIAATTLEDEALAAAATVEAALRGGARRVAIVALDRLVARRTRALLERAGILVADEAGWKLSTTAAAAALMRWYDLVAGDARWVDLLDWLKAPAVYAADPLKGEALQALEATLRARAVLGGWGAIEQALRHELAHASDEDQPALQRASQWIGELAALARQTRNAGRWASQLEALDALDRAVGLFASLAQDVAGAKVLAQQQRLRAEKAIEGRYALTEWRAVLADALEQAEFVDAGTESRVAMVSLAGSWLRSFDAVVLVGADAEHLPAAPPADALLPTALRRELKLPDAAAARRAALVTLAALLARSPAASFTWQSRRNDAENLESPWLARLRALAAAAGLPDPVQPAAGLLAAHARTVASSGEPMPAPAAPALLPASISAGAYADLVACPYRYFALRMAQLAPLAEIDEDPAAQRVGEALHRALQRWHEAGGDSAPPDALASLQTQIDAAFAPLVDELPSYFAAARQWRHWAGEYLHWLATWSAKGWHFAQAEVRAERELSLPHGTLRLVGRIDRIDEWEHGGFAVLDYKTGGNIAALKEATREPAESPQLAFYCALLPEPPALAAYVALRAERAQFDLHTADDPGSLAQQLRERLTNQLNRIAQGSPLPAHGAAEVCERCEARGLCRRAYRVDGTGQDEVALERVSE